MDRANRSAGEIVSVATPEADELRRRAERCWAQDQSRDALEAAWAAFELSPENPAARRLLVRLLDSYRTQLDAGRLAGYLKLLTHPEVEPDLISTAGWHFLLRGIAQSDELSDSAYERLTERLEHDDLALTLLRESPVYLVPAERLLTGARRWLLHSGYWRRRPALVAALTRQMRLNGGAWPFDSTERSLLAQPENGVVAAAFLPMRTGSANAIAREASDPVTAKVAAQYESWPYPPWTRITVGEPRRLPDVVAEMDTEAAKSLPANADMLIAGCGTGRQAASVATRHPDASVTAIDVSAASLDYAKRQCCALGIANLRFLQLDLHEIGKLGQRFHAIFSAGVLHHLPNPERGFAVLADVLHPNGVMHLMVYNRLQRLMITAARGLITDLLQQPVGDDLLREVRRRLLAHADRAPAAQVVASRDFATLAGTQDLLLHRHEDPFDVSRIERALAAAGLRLMRFDMPSPVAAARYDAEFPSDPGHRDVASWATFTRHDPSAMAGHFRFWCAKNPH